MFEEQEKKTELNEARRQKQMQSSRYCTKHAKLCSDLIEAQKREPFVATVSHQRWFLIPVSAVPYCAEEMKRATGWCVCVWGGGGGVGGGTDEYVKLNCGSVVEDCLNWQPCWKFTVGWLLRWDLRGIRQTERSFDWIGNEHCFNNVWV